MRRRVSPWAGTRWDYRPCLEPLLRGQPRTDLSPPRSTLRIPCGKGILGRSLNPGKHAAQRSRCSDLPDLRTTGRFFAIWQSSLSAFEEFSPVTTTTERTLKGIQKETRGRLNSLSSLLSRGQSVSAMPCGRRQFLPVGCTGRAGTVAAGRADAVGKQAETAGRAGPRYSA